LRFATGREFTEERESEGCGFASSRLGGANDIIALENFRDGGFLDGGGVFVPAVGDSLQDRLRKTKIRK
jgi:hypothetical protein